MQEVIDFLSANLFPWVIGAGALLVLVGVVLIVIFVGRARFARRVRAYLAIPGTPERSDYFQDDELLRRTRQVVRMIATDGEHIVGQLGVDELWIARLGAQPRAADFKRVLAYATDKGLFTCFLGALRNPGLRSRLRTYLAENTDFLVLRQLAASGRGEVFNGKAARTFFADRLDEIREMTGDPEWPSRYFATKVLLHDDDERSLRALRDAFADPHPLVRRTVTTEYQTENRTELYERLLSLFRGDPVFEVRLAARDRIKGEFTDLYTLDPASLSAEEALHVIELLDPDNPQDENAALQLLTGGNEELRLAAARLLAKSGTLDRLFMEADTGDREGLDRTFTVLSNAAGVNVVSFLNSVKKSPGPGTLLLAARLLQTHGSSALVVETAERVFRAQQEATPTYLELYGETVTALSMRGSDDALRILEKEIVRRRDTPEMLASALRAVPAGRDHVFAGTLFAALRDPGVPERDALREAVRKLSPERVIEETYHIITAGRDRFPHLVRIDALKVLAELNLPYLTQDILEHLPILPVEEAREFTALLDRTRPAEFERKVGLLLDGVDANIRAALIAALPSTGKKTFLSQVRDALSDADPDVRIAATWALVDYGETRSLSRAAELLRDPVERVRGSVARALASAGTTQILEMLTATLGDDNEVGSVKLSAIEGLAVSKLPEAVDALVGVLENDEEHREAARVALSAKHDSRSIARLVEHFKDAPPSLRDEITASFKMMGENSESAIRTVLDEDIASLKAQLAEILEATGYVESRIRMLSHRDPKIRRSAASFLSRVGSRAAFRGIVMAARDPDSDVRVEVTRALEYLATEEGTEILHSLEEDPDRRIRKYTHWALERLRAKSL